MFQDVKNGSTGFRFTIFVILKHFLKLTLDLREIPDRVVRVDSKNDENDH